MATTALTSAVGGSGGLGGINIGKTKALATNDVLSWDGSNWVNSVASGGTVVTDATLTGDGSGGAPLHVVSPFTGVTTDTTLSGIGTVGNVLKLPAVVTGGTNKSAFGSSITYDNQGRITAATDNPATNYVWLFQGTATVASSATPVTVSNLVLTGGAPTNNPGTAFDLTTVRFTAPSSGMYSFFVSGNFPGLTPGVLGCGWLGLTNAFGALTTYQYFDVKTAQTGSGTFVNGGGQMYLTTGDTARVYFAQNTGSSQTVSNLTICVFGMGKV